MKTSATTKSKGGEATPSIGIYRHEYLRPTETFIVDHINTLKRHVPVPICEKQVPGGLSAPGHPVQQLVADTGVRRIVETASLTRLGVSPVLRGIVRERKIGLLHAHFLTDGMRLMPYARRHRMPLLVTAHGYDATYYDKTWRSSANGRRFLRERPRLFEQATMILCVSKFIRDELRARGASADKLLVRPLGIDLAQFSPGPPPSERRGILFAGRLVEKKGARYLIEAWRGLSPEVRAQGLTIIGEGSESEDLRELAADHPEIRFEGSQRRKTVLEAMARHRAFAFPSLRAVTGDAEGMGVVAMEAQALGTPVVAFDDGPVREVMAPDRSGLMVPPADVGAFRQALQSILQDDALADRLGGEARRVVAERFDLHRNTAAIEDVYAQILAKADREQPPQPTDRHARA